jgi:hypothetical protein
MTIRPLFTRDSNIASSSTSRCLLMAGNEMPKGAAISPTLNSGRLAKAARMARRVESASAENVVSSACVII